MTLTIAGEPLIAYLLASLRIVAWLVVVPPFSTRAVPTMAKVILSLGLAFAILPGVADGGVPTGTAELATAAATQALIGASMGFVTYLIFAAIQAAGSIIDIFGGFALAQAFDPLSFTMNTIFGKLHQMLGTMLLFASGAHLIVIGGLLKTFDLLPVGGVLHTVTMTSVVMTAFGMFFASAVQIALPMIAVLFIADLGLALMTKVAPQLNAITVMFPAKIGLTLLFVGLSFPVLPGVVDRMVELAVQAMATMAGAG
jgi:flagellar biosynthesis protein FliR